jgi:fructosamine-3-kinase
VDPVTAARLTGLLGCDLTAAVGLGGQHGVRHYRLTLADGRVAFAKVLNHNSDGNARVRSPAGAPAEGASDPSPDPAGFGAEAAGLIWLAEAGAAAVPGVLGHDQRCLVIEWIDARPASPAAAREFGGRLARLHQAGASRFGAPWPAVIAGLPLPSGGAGRASGESGEAAADWPDWFAANRLLPYVRIASDRGSLSPADVRVLESAAGRAAALAGPPGPPSRIHGDCWSGNVLWAGGQGWLIDPAAQGGHRETDLAMLALFGVPYLAEIMAGYQQAAPLADGWRDRVPLHQLHPLLVHVCLFGSGYRDSALAAAQAILRA